MASVLHARLTRPVLEPSVVFERPQMKPVTGACRTAIQVTPCIHVRSLIATTITLHWAGEGRGEQKTCMHGTCAQLSEHPRSGLSPTPLHTRLLPNPPGGPLLLAAHGMGSTSKGRGGERGLFSESKRAREQRLNERLDINTKGPLGLLAGEEGRTVTGATS